MSNRVLIKRGLSNDLNKAGTVAGELKYATDTKKLYIGDGINNVEIGAGSVIELDSYDDLPDVNVAEKHKLYYCKDLMIYCYVREINGVYYFRYNSCPTYETLNATISQLYQYVSSDDKIYHAEFDTDGYDYVTINSSTLPAKGTYDDGMFVVLRGTSKLYICNSSLDSGYEEITNFTYSYYSVMTPANVTIGDYFYHRGYDKLYYIKAVNWVEFNAIRVTDLPTQDKRIVGRFYYRGTTIYEGYENKAPTLSWENLKTDIDLAAIVSQIDGKIAGKFDVEEYEYMTPTASSETMGKLYMWKEQSIYMLTAYVGRVVNTVVTATIQEEQESSGDDSGDGELILLPIGLNYEPYMEGTLANRPDAGYGCVCYYATDVDKYYISTASTGGFLNYYWTEVSMTTRSSAPTTGSNVGYYKVVNGNTVTIYNVYDQYKWVNLTTDQHPYLKAQKSTSTSVYAGFYLNYIQLDYTEKDLSSMDEGTLYGVIEDA